MRFDGLDIPGAVIDALGKNQLVVFAGAGVSMAPPSSLPGFAKLADEIGTNSEPRAQNDRIDSYLGLLQGRGVEVHRRASEILSSPGSEPSSLHHSLVALFRRPEAVRLVTTNFDRHFELALGAAWPGAEAEVFSAPALPVGSRFSGIVHLHGCLGPDPARLVLTDSDFGRAYLTEGWARRFLMSIFERFTVLFVGYKHEDLDAIYLARGLPATSSHGRFALAPSGDSDRWHYLGIEVIEYDKSDDHRTLHKGLERWAQFSHRGALDHERRIVDILKRTTQALTVGESDYLLGCLDDPELARFFFRHARDVEWLSWAENKGILRPVLSQNERFDQSQSLLVAWFADFATGQQADTVLHLVAEAGCTLSQPAAAAVTHRILGCLREKNRSEEDARNTARWLSILQRCGLPSIASGSLTQLLNECDLSVDHAWVVPLFDYLTRPRIQHERSFAILVGDSTADSTDPEIDLRGDAYWLHQAWRNTLRPGIETLADDLVPVVRAHLERSHLLLRGLGRADKTWDPEDFHRSSIAPSEQDDQTSPRAFNVLIDAARDLVEFYLEHDRDCGLRLLESWWRSPAPLVRRVGLHGLARDAGRKASDKLRIVEAMGWLNQRQLKPELFALLRETYPKASAQARRRFLQHAARLRLSGRRIGGPLAAQAAKDKQLHSEVYEYYNLLLWLDGGDADCEMVRARLARVRRYWPEFKPQEHPDLDHFNMGVHAITAESPVSVQRIRLLSPEQYLEELADVKEARREWGDFNDPLRGFLGATSKAAEEDFTWSLHLAGLLAAEGWWDDEPWESLISGWNAAKLESPLWQSLLAFLESNPRVLAISTLELTRLLEDRLDVRAPEADEPMVMRAAEFAELLWAQAVDLPTPEIAPVRSWLDLAINHPTGKLAVFAVRASSVLHKAHGPSWRDHSASLCALLHQMTDRGKQATLARVVLCSQLHFFFDADCKWTHKHLLPLFDWSDEKTVAAQAWDGFLFWGSNYPALWSELRPLVLKTFEHLNRLGEARTRFGELVASAAAFFEDQPIEHLGLLEYLRQADSDGRLGFARHITKILRNAEPTAIAELWNRWLYQYICERHNGTPPLDDEEWKEIFRWALYLDAEFPEAVDLITGRPVTVFGDEFVFLALAERLEKLTVYPDPLGRFLLHILEGVGEHFWSWDKVGETVEALVAVGADNKLLLEILDRCAALGWSRAAEIRSKLADPDQDASK